MANSREFVGAFAPELKLFLDGKRALGIKYIDEERMLHVLDRLCVSRDRADGFTKELALKFTQPRPNWSQSTYEKHVNLMSQVAKFLNLHGIAAYMPDTKLKLGISRSFTPYIFSADEMKIIFEAADNLYAGRSYCYIHEKIKVKPDKAA